MAVVVAPRTKAEGTPGWSSYFILGAATWKELATAQHSTLLTSTLSLGLELVSGRICHTVLTRETPQWHRHCTWAACANGSSRRRLSNGLCSMCANCCLLHCVKGLFRNMSHS